MKALAAALLFAGATGAAATPNPPAWSQPTAPFAIIGPIHYVGTRGLAAYLITTRDGAILIDGTLPDNVPAIERNIVASGVPLASVKILLNSHAHFDHAGGLARLKHDTGARLMVMQGDARAIAAGFPIGDNPFNAAFSAAPVDRILTDGATVSLGGVTLTALRTAGHTPGCTSWTMTVIDQGTPRHVIFPCSLSVAGNVLIGNRTYPAIVRDYRASFARLKAMQADIVLTAHPEFSDVMGRAARQKAGVRNAFVDPGQLRRLVDDAEATFNKALATESRRRHPG
jgi:metallo-beta-lactamase class B